MSNNSGRWSSTELKYYKRVLGCIGSYEAEKLKYHTVDDVERTYTPDFVTTASDADGNAVKVYHEVKGSWSLYSQAAARLHWELSVAANPSSIFVWAKEMKHSLWWFQIWSDGGRKKASKRGAKGFAIIRGSVTWV